MKQTSDNWIIEPLQWIEQLFNWLHSNCWNAFDASLDDDDSLLFFFFVRFYSVTCSRFSSERCTEMCSNVLCSGNACIYIFRNEIGNDNIIVATVVKQQVKNLANNYANNDHDGDSCSVFDWILKRFWFSHCDPILMQCSYYTK